MAKKSKPKKKKYVSAAKGYNPDEGYFKSLLKAVQENPMSEVPYSKKGPYNRLTKKELLSKERDSKTKQRAKQIQIEDFRKKSLTLKKMSHGGKITSTGKFRIQQN